jgi:hypothetical protein
MTVWGLISSLLDVRENFKFFFENGAERREKILCDTARLPKHERVARHHRVFAERVPYKSFVIIDLIEIDNDSPRGKPRLDSGSIAISWTTSGLERVGETMPIQCFARACRTLRPILNGAGLSVALLRDRRSGKLCG